MPLPRVVIVGRPNVGKSSLLNWIAGRRIAIVDDVAGVTRDRITTLAEIPDGRHPRFVELIDTGGVGIVDRDDLGEHVEHQIETALGEADVILFVVDVREGLMPLDEEVARRLRYLQAPVILVLNKADDPKFDDQGQEFYRLGRGQPVPISTQQNRNKSELLALVAKHLPPDDEESKVQTEAMKIAVVGRPNTGKSTFINTLAHAERMIVSEVPGTTRDSVDVRFELDGLPFVAIDTAGVRRKAKIRDDLDFYSLHRAERSVRRADVVFLFIDPTQGVTRLDKQLADYIAKQFKPCVIVINKWDLILSDMTGPARGETGRYAIMVQHAFKGMAYAPIAFITALTGKNVKALINLAQAMYKRSHRRIGTGMLNRILREAVTAHAPPMRENRVAKIFFGTQVGIAPPTIVLFVNRPGLFDPTYQRYLLNVFREQLPFGDVPIKLYLRARTQSEASGRSATEDEPPDITQREAADQSLVDELDDEINELLGDLE